MDMLLAASSLLLLLLFVEASLSHILPLAFVALP